MRVGTNAAQHDNAFPLYLKDFITSEDKNITKMNSFKFFLNHKSFFYINHFNIKRPSVVEKERNVFYCLHSFKHIV